MPQWFAQNWGNIVILSALALIVGAIVFFRFRSKRKGKGGCGCGCSHCAMNGMCHAAKVTDKDDEK